MTMIQRIAACLVLGMSIAGCESVKHIATSIIPTNEQTDESFDPRVYPKDMPLGEELRIEVRRVDRKHIQIENRTAVPYTQVQLWINEEYGASIGELPLGKSGNIPLVQFINHFGEQYPVGSFLEPEKSKRVVAATIVMDGELRPLGIRLPDDWRYR